MPRPKDRSGRLWSGPCDRQITVRWVRPPPVGWRQEMQPLSEEPPKVDPDGGGPGEDERHDSFEGVGRWWAARQWQTGRQTEPATSWSPDGLGVLGFRSTFGTSTSRPLRPQYEVEQPGTNREQLPVVVLIRCRHLHHQTPRARHPEAARQPHATARESNAGRRLGP